MSVLALFWAGHGPGVSSILVSEGGKRSPSWRIPFRRFVFETSEAMYSQI